MFYEEKNSVAISDGSITILTRLLLIIRSRIYLLNLNIVIISLVECMHVIVPFGAFHPLGKPAELTAQYLILKS